MKYIFLLSGDYVELGREEIVSLFDMEDYKIIDKLLIIDFKNDNILNKTFQRLALTKYIYKLLFECKVNDLIKAMKKYDWNSVYRDDFCLRINNFDNRIIKKYINGKNNKNIQKKSKTTSESQHEGSNPFATPSEKELAGYIWRNSENPKVNLENPKTLIQLFIIKNKVYCGLLIYDNKEDFESRKSHLRPFPHPSSLHPKVARALVNITGIKET